MSISLGQARIARRKADAFFSTFPGPTACGLGGAYGEYTIKVSLSQPLPDGTIVPTDFQGVPVTVSIVGETVPRT